jgi:hypothetical protein
VTYLELVQALWVETGSGGPKPAAVDSVTGEAERLVTWIALADKHIQSDYIDWKFLWKQGSFNTVASTRDYALPADLSIIDKDTVRIDGDELRFMNYLDFKSEYVDASEGRPWRAIQLPNRQLRLDPTPGDAYAITFDYFQKPVAMTVANDSQSIIPSEFHEAILGKAIMYYAEYENAPEQMAKGQALYDHHYSNLTARELPGDRDAHKIAEGNDLVVRVE